MRFTDVTEQRTRVDWARWVKMLVNVGYPDVVCRILNNCRGMLPVQHHVLSRGNGHDTAQIFYDPHESLGLGLQGLGLQSRPRPAHPRRKQSLRPHLRTPSVLSPRRQTHEKYQILLCESALRFDRVNVRQ